MNGPALFACPLTHVEGFRLPDVSARGAALCGREPAVYLHERLAIPLGFVFKLAHDQSPTYITDRAGKTPILLHVLHGQRLTHDQVIFFDQLCRELARPVAALIGYLRVAPFATRRF